MTMYDHSDARGDDAARAYYEEAMAEREIERQRELDDLRAESEPDEPPMTESEWAELTAHDDLLEAGAYNDVAPAPPGPPCQHEGCGLTLASNGRRWWHQENMRADRDHDAEPCGCRTQGGIVQDVDPWCPLHGAEDALSGAVWVSPTVARQLARELAAVAHRQ